MTVAGVVEAAGHECVTAADGTAGWELLASSGADVVISDGRMPDLDGIELCRRIRAEVPRYTYVVLATSRSDRAEVLEGQVVTVSAGVATWEPATTQHVLLADADAARYEAKAAGRNAVRSVEPVRTAATALSPSSSSKRLASRATAHRAGLGATITAAPRPAG